MSICTHASITNNSNAEAGTESRETTAEAASKMPVAIIVRILRDNGESDKGSSSDSNYRK